MLEQPGEKLVVLAGPEQWMELYLRPEKQVTGIHHNPLHGCEVQVEGKQDEDGLVCVDAKDQELYEHLWITVQLAPPS